MSKEKPMKFILIYNNGVVRAYNRMPSNIHELLEMGIVKHCIDLEELKAADREFQWHKICEVTNP